MKMENNEDYIEKIDGAERRFFTQDMEVRTEDQGSTVEGIAAVVNTRTNMGWYDEEVMVGAFDEVMQDDVRCLLNHDPNFVLARSNKGEGTLALSINDRGDLAYKYKTPNRTYAKDLEDAIRTGDVSQSSFGFSIKEDIWEKGDDGRDVRKIVRCGRLFDVSPVGFPAYESTSTTIAKRSFEVQKKAAFVKDYVKYNELKLKELKSKKK